MSEDKTLEKIRKLLAFGNDERGNEQERENALRMAHAMLMKHNLELEDVGIYERECMDPREHLQEEGWNMSWTREVRKSIAKLFFCKYIRGPKINATKGVHNFVGRASNVTTALYMSTWIVRNVMKQADREHGHRLSAAGRAFAVGVSDILRVRVNEMLAQAEKDAVLSTGRELVVVKLVESEESENNIFMRKVMKITMRKVVVHGVKHEHSDSYQSGREFGGKINLNPQVATNKDNLRLK